MKKILFVLLGFFICQPNAFADKLQDCLNAAHNNDYFEQNKHRQIGGAEWDKLDEQGKKEARIRNLCFGASIDWHAFCGWAKCDESNVEIWGHTLSEYCEYAKTDCFTADIDTVFAVLQDSGDYVFNMFMPSMNNITQEIANGDEQISYIDTDKTVCYRTDDNGDTVWHVFVRNNKSITGWANLCVSVNDGGFDMIKRALYKTKNNKGRTAVQDAIDSKNPDNLFGFLTMYAKQQDKNYCKSLPQEISKTNGISLQKVQSLLNCK